MTKLELGNGHIHYSKYGNGNEILIAFHGFGQDKNIFKEWGEILGKKYTIYALDIFYHGESERTYGKLSKNEWKEVFYKFLVQEGIQDYTVLGYSLGGRFAIASSLNFPERTKEIILIAPDGIFLTIWFQLATNPAIRWLFKYYMLHPKKLERLIRYNERLKLFSPYMGDFVKKELGDSENRKRVYVSWNDFKSLGYSKKMLAQKFNQYPFAKRIILGSKDHIIRPDKILPIIKTMGDFKVDILDKKHHQLVKPEVAKLILNSNSL